MGMRVTQSVRSRGHFMYADVPKASDASPKPLVKGAPSRHKVSPIARDVTGMSHRYRHEHCHGPALGYLRGPLESMPDPSSHPLASLALTGRAHEVLPTCVPGDPPLAWTPALHHGPSRRTALSAALVRFREPPRSTARIEPLRPRPMGVNRAELPALANGGHERPPQGLIDGGHLLRLWTS